MVGEIERLIVLLDDDSTEVAESAKAELVSIGTAVVEPLMAAIEVFEHFGSVAAGPVLIELLGSGHETVREWSAYAIAQLDVRDAVPALEAAYRRQRASGDPPDF